MFSIVRLDIEFRNPLLSFLGAMLLWDGAFCPPGSPNLRHPLLPAFDPPAGVL